MKHYHIYFLAICLFLSSCATATYFGDTLPPTKTVDIYYSAHDIKKDYKVIGHLNCPNIGEKPATALLIKKAESIGADAIVITGNTVNDGSKYTSDVVNADAVKYK